MGLSVPVLLGHVPPNFAHGFRTAKRLGSPEAWYVANAFAAKASLICASVMSLLGVGYLGNATISISVAGRSGDETPILATTPIPTPIPTPVPTPMPN